jgi:hypothetical protein
MVKAITHRSKLLFCFQHFLDNCFFSFLRWGETESTRYVGHYWPIVPAPDDWWWWLWSDWWNNWQGKPKYSEKTCLSTTLSTTNPTWPDPDSNPGRRGGKPTTNHLSYCTALLFRSYYRISQVLIEVYAEKATWLKSVFFLSFYINERTHGELSTEVYMKFDCSCGASVCC